MKRSTFSWLLILVTGACFIQGCASTPHRRLSTFPTAEELMTPQSYRSSYAEARVDFQRAAKGLSPRYATQRSALRDGGTVFYKGSGYDITVWKRLSTMPDGTTYVYSGPEIHFSRLLSPRGAASYSSAQSRRLH